MFSSSSLRRRRVKREKEEVQSTLYVLLLGCWCCCWREKKEPREFIVSSAWFVMAINRHGKAFLWEICSPSPPLRCGLLRFMFDKWHSLVPPTKTKPAKEDEEEKNKKKRVSGEPEPRKEREREKEREHITKKISSKAISSSLSAFLYISFSLLPTFS